MACPPHTLRLKAAGESFLDSNIVMMGLRFYCVNCGQPFKALGVREGVNPKAPGFTDDGEVTVFPLVPIDEEPQLALAGFGTC